MDVRSLRDKAAIENYLRINSDLNFYQIADLEEPFWSQTEWFGAHQGNEVAALAMLYHGFAPPILTVLAPAGDRVTVDLVANIREQFPPKFYAAVTEGLLGELQTLYQFNSHGMHFKMSLKDQTKLRVEAPDATVLLGADDFSEVTKFYNSCYPGNWWNKGMLETGVYRGVRDKGELIAVGGTHIVSRQYRVAALGNIVTHPAHRGQGLAKQITARVCLELLDEVDLIGLNVKADNEAAIACYKKLGFEIIAPYEENDCVRYK